MAKIKDYLFHGFDGCYDGGCVVRDVKGMHTNGGCHCMANMGRAQLGILSARLRTIGQLELPADLAEMLEKANSTEPSA